MLYVYFVITSMKDTETFGCFVDLLTTKMIRTFNKFKFPIFNYQLLYSLVPLSHYISMQNIPVYNEEISLHQNYKFMDLSKNMLLKNHVLDTVRCLKMYMPYFQLSFIEILFISAYYNSIFHLRSLSQWNGISRINSQTFKNWFIKRHTKLNWDISWKLAQGCVLMVKT